MDGFWDNEHFFLFEGSKGNFFYFFNIKDKCYVHNIFTTNFKWQVVIGCYYMGKKVISVVVKITYKLEGSSMEDMESQRKRKREHCACVNDFGMY